MNEYIELMERTLSVWVKEYPIEWIELAYKDTVGVKFVNICPHCGEYIGEEE